MHLRRLCKFLDNSASDSSVGLPGVWAWARPLRFLGVSLVCRGTPGDRLEVWVAGPCSRVALPAVPAPLSSTVAPAEGGHGSPALQCVNFAV